ncbi:MAG: hypothetical protein ABL963_04045 [Longimicrobiales bacterium]
MSKGTVKVRLVFADGGAFHSEEIEIPVASLRAHERLVDCLREDDAVLARVHLDPARLCAAFVVDGA